MISAIVIPAHSGQAPRLQEIAPSDLNARQTLVGGHIEAVNLYEPDGTLYINEEGKLIGLRPNPRATALLWVHNKQLRGSEWLAGDAVLVGPPDNEGNDKTAPQELVDIITKTQRFHVEEQTTAEEAWHNSRFFRSWYAAYRYAAIRAWGNGEVTDVRVIEAP